MSLIVPPDSNRTARTESPLVPSLTKRFALSLARVCELAWHGLGRPQPRSTRNTCGLGRGDFPGGNREHVGSDAEDAVLALGDCGRADVQCARTRRSGTPGRPSGRNHGRRRPALVPLPIRRTLARRRCVHLATEAMGVRSRGCVRVRARLLVLFIHPGPPVQPCRFGILAGGECPPPTAARRRLFGSVLYQREGGTQPEAVPRDPDVLGRVAHRCGHWLRRRGPCRRRDRRRGHPWRPRGGGGGCRGFFRTPPRGGAPAQPPFPPPLPPGGRDTGPTK